MQSIRALTLVALVLVLLPSQAIAAALPAPPAVFLDTTPVAPTGRTRTVNAGGDLQGALDAAAPGDVIVLQAGATFTGSFTLPSKSGSGWITVRTSTPDTRLPIGTRVTPADAALMPTIVGPGGRAAITTAPGARHYRFIGIEVKPAAGTYTYGLIVLGTGSETSVDALPSDIVFDRCYIHGDPLTGGKRGIALNSRSTAIVDSWLSDWKGVGQDTQAIAGWNGPGPYKLVNNYLEGAGENVIFGGADPSIPDLTPSDIEIRRNDVVKPLAWNSHRDGFEGTRWTVKNLFELKNAARVLVDGNVFENNWVDAQSGFAVQLTVRNQDGDAPWSVVKDVAFTNNVVRNSAAGINILGRDDSHPSAQAARLLVQNNVFEKIGAAGLGTNGRLFQLLSDATDVVIEHNTAFTTGNTVTAGGEPTLNFVYRNNISAHNEYGIIGDGTGVGLRTLERYFPGGVVTHNVLAGGEARLYPAGNFFPASLAAVGFASESSGDYRLTQGAYERAGADGTDLGADIDAIIAARTDTDPGDTASVAVASPPRVHLPPPTPRERRRGQR